MRVRLAEIDERGLDLECGESPRELGLQYPDAAFKENVETQIRLTRFNDEVIVSGSSRTIPILECARCLKAFSHLMSLTFKTVFCPEENRSKTSTKEGELNRDDTGLYYYSGTTIDLGEFIREQIILALPMVPLCRPDCLGLCSQCGRNRNNQECTCMTEEGNGTSKA